MYGEFHINTSPYGGYWYEIGMQAAGVTYVEHVRSCGGDQVLIVAFFDTWTHIVTPNPKTKPSNRIALLQSRLYSCNT